MTQAMSEPGQPGNSGRSQAAAAFRVVAGLIETRDDLPEPSATSRLLTAGSSCHDIPSALAVISAELPSQWQPVIGRTFRTPAARRPHGTGCGPGTHLCPAAGCGQHISADRFMCRAHWYQVPKLLRDTVWATWQSGAGVGTAEHTAAVLSAIAAASGARTRHQRPPGSNA